MTSIARRLRRGSRESHALLSTLCWYWLRAFPLVQDELAHWRERAAAVPDATLRRHATATLADEHMNAEGAAVFASLAACPHRTAAARLLVRYQVLYDYLDTLTEQSVLAPLAASRHLHRALTAALGEAPPANGFYALYPHFDDGGYLAELVTSCRTAFRALPAAGRVEAAALRAARRSAEGQSQNHAAMLADERSLVCWARRETPPTSGLRWWETAAAAGSSLGIHALLASAADPALTSDDVDAIEAAYWPWIAGLNTLLESAVDLSADAETGNHSYVSHYATSDLMADRLDHVASCALDAARRMPSARRHVAILTGMAAFYLAMPEADSIAVRPTTQRVRANLGPALWLPLLMLRTRRRVGRRLKRRRAAPAAPASAA